MTKHIGLVIYCPIGIIFVGIVAPTNKVFDAYRLDRGPVDTVEKVLDFVQIGELGFVHSWIPFSLGNMSHYRHACGRSG